ncbi:hypothetical protein [Phenylobacterium sp.]|uniref:hypothetical protein n=1 Tax=Phenylobacterium sp. TaxID=1871053 RepID=UPI0035AD8570
MRTLAAALAVFAVSAGVADAQTPRSSSDPAPQQERIEAILGALFGGRGAATSLDTQWSLGRLPLAQQRAQFEARIDSDVRSGALNRAAGERAKADYLALVDLEARYGVDRRFSVQERAELNDRYDSLTRLVAEGGYAGGVSGASVADGRREFEARVDESVRLRRLTRTQGTQLKTEYASLVAVESDYLRDGVLSVRERSDLETRLDALDARVGDMNLTRSSDPAERLQAIARALPASGLSAAAQAQLRVEHEDLSRLAAAYRRLTPTREEQAYLDQRLTDLEARARARR